MLKLSNTMLTGMHGVKYGQQRTDDTFSGHIQKIVEKTNKERMRGKQRK